MKTCRICKDTKTINSYSVRKETGTLRTECKLCMAKKAKNWYKNNKKVASNTAKSYYLLNKEHIKNNVKAYYEKNKSNIKSKRKLYFKNYIKVNRAKLTAKEGRRRALKKLATPKWLDNYHLQQIENIYKLANVIQNNLNIKMSVDHIIPLKGKNVCGLHVPWNLQILPFSLNASKRNKLIEVTK